jgi:hypothetical protein
MGRDRIFPFFAIYITLFFLLLISCTKAPNNPIQPANAAIYLTIKSPTLKKNVNQFVDSVGNSINIGVASNFPSFVDSILIEICSLDGAVEGGTILKGMDSLQSTDTLWYKGLFISDGIKSIIAQAYIRDQ